MSRFVEVVGSVTCPICGVFVEEPLRAHILQAHDEADFKHAVLSAKQSGMSDQEIGQRFGISYARLQRIITEHQGINISQLRKTRPIKHWEPPDFQEQRTTVWSFPQRGSWATHTGDYRGNWSPYIPRNIILKYSKPGDVVLDYFVGSGTTAVEAKLLGRRCIAWDINPSAVVLTQRNLAFTPPMVSLFETECYEPEVRVGDARRLDGIEDGSIDLICAHPPYAGIIKYSTGIEGDLSGLDVPEFLNAMQKVAEESYRVLKPGGICAILIGDARRARRIVPIGFETIRTFLNAGFQLKELIIKRQHNCKTTGFWYNRSIAHNFLLLAHEYLPVFEKRGSGSLSVPSTPNCTPITFEEEKHQTNRPLETTTVWLFPEDAVEQETVRNLACRYANEEVLVLRAQDERQEGVFIPNGLLTYERMQYESDLNLREIIIVAPSAPAVKSMQKEIQIIHHYVLVYEKNNK